MNAAHCPLCGHDNDADDTVIHRHGDAELHCGECATVTRTTATLPDGWLLS